MFMTDNQNGATTHHSLQDLGAANNAHAESSASENRVMQVQAEVHKVTRHAPRKIRLPQQKIQDEGGKEVSLRSLTGSKVVALGTLQKTDRMARCADGLPLGEYYEVLLNVVFDKNTMLPRPQGKVMKLGAVVGCCIAWPHQNIIQLDGSLLHGSRHY